MQTSQPGKTHLVLFNKASGWNFCPFRWNEEKTAVTQKLFCTLGDMFALEVTKDILWRPVDCKSSLKQLRLLPSRHSSPSRSWSWCGHQDMFFSCAGKPPSLICHSCHSKIIPRFFGSEAVWKFLLTPEVTVSIFLQSDSGICEVKISPHPNPLSQLLV